MEYIVFLPILILGGSFVILTVIEALLKRNKSRELQRNDDSGAETISPSGLPELLNASLENGSQPTGYSARWISLGRSRETAMSYHDRRFSDN